MNDPEFVLNQRGPDTYYLIIRFEEEAPIEMVVDADALRRLRQLVDDEIGPPDPEP